MVDTTERSELMSKANNLPFSNDAVTDFAERGGYYFGKSTVFFFYGIFYVCVK
jgi:hypothetical protein